jgi:hypothetical protein
MAAKADAPRLLVVAIAFATADEVFYAGDLVDADHPAVKKYPDSFGPLVVQHPAQRGAGPVIEQATAAPGEKRGA